MMTKTNPTDVRMVLAAQTAEDLMTPNPISIQANATVQEAVVLMTDRGYSAAPVIDEAGRPIGVLSRTDILVHSREHGRHAPLYDTADWESSHDHRPKEGFSV
jgi:CBS-domain-containing membrane protein